MEKAGCDRETDFLPYLAAEVGLSAGFFSEANVGLPRPKTA
jgi:hypothetical protein